MLTVALAAVALIGMPCLPRCSCMPRNEQEQFHSADAVFTARVLHVGEIEVDGSSGDDGEDDGFSMRTRQVRVEVVERRKGQVPDTLAVRVAAGGGMCGYAFYEGRLYLIYAGRQHDPSGASHGWSTGMCSGTRDLHPDAPPSTPPESIFVGRHVRAKLPPDTHYPRRADGVTSYLVGWHPAGGPRIELVFREFPAAGTRLKEVADSLRNARTQGESGVAQMDAVPLAYGTAYRWTLYTWSDHYWETLLGTEQGTLLVSVVAATLGDRELAERTWRTVLDELDWRP